MGLKNMCQNFVCRTRSKNPNLWVIHQTGKGCHGDLEVWRRSGTDLCDCMAANVKNQSVCHLE